MPHMPYAPGVTDITPQHHRRHVCATLHITERTLQRYTAELRPMQVLTCAAGANGETLFSDEDVSFLTRYRDAKSTRAREGMAATQRERIAQLSAGVGRRSDAEAIRRALRAQGEGLPMRGRVGALLAAVPGLRGARPVQRLVWYYSTFYQTADLVRLEADAAPPPSSVERAFREMLARRG